MSQQVNATEKKQQEGLRGAPSYGYNNQLRERMAHFQKKFILILSRNTNPSPRLASGDVILILNSWGWLQFGPGDRVEKNVFTISDINKLKEHKNEKGGNIFQKSVERSRQQNEAVQLQAIRKALSDWWNHPGTNENSQNFNNLYLVLGDISSIITMPVENNFVRRGNWIRTNYRIPKALSCPLATDFPGSYACVRKKVFDDFYSSAGLGFMELFSRKIAGVFPMDNLLVHHKNVKERLSDKFPVVILNLEGRRTRIFLIEHGKLECIAFDVTFGVMDIVLDLGCLDNLEECVKSLLPIDQDELLRLMHSYPVPRLAIQRFFSNLLGSLRLVLEQYSLQEGRSLPKETKFFLAGGFSLSMGGNTDKDWKFFLELGKRVVQILGFDPEVLPFVDGVTNPFSFSAKEMQRIGGIYFAKPDLRQVPGKDDDEEIEKYYSEKDLYYSGNTPANHTPLRIATAFPESFISIQTTPKPPPAVSGPEKFPMSIQKNLLFGGLVVVSVVMFLLFRWHYNSVYDEIYNTYKEASKVNEKHSDELNEYRSYYGSSLSSRLFRLIGGDERINLKRLHVKKLEKGKYKMTLEGTFLNELQGDGTKKEFNGISMKPDKNEDAKTWSGSFKEYLRRLFMSTEFVNYTIDELKIVEQDHKGYGFIVTIIESNIHKRIDL
ncbi:MAG: hypothetical protein HQL76_01915 [Magnetococcales bacterium]|nr:hypothetical protein [Magnetococcales bacterium]